MSRCKCVFLGLFVLVLFAAPAYSQAPLICTMSATPPTVRSEGLAEKMGDIVLHCSGGTPGLVITGNLSISLSVPITNRLISGTTSDLVVTVDTGSGPVAASFSAQLLTPQTVSLNN